MQHWAELTDHSVYAELTVFCVLCAVCCILCAVCAGGGSAEEVQHWACRVYAELLRQLPVLARAWRSGCERPLALRVERLTSEHVSPLLLREEFGRLQAADTAADNMTVRARPSVREVSAVYTMEEACTELVVRLPADYPLGHVVADAAGRRVGVAAGQWRMWMLQLTTFLTHQVSGHCQYLPGHSSSRSHWWGPGRASSLTVGRGRYYPVTAPPAATGGDRGGPLRCRWGEGGTTRSQLLPQPLVGTGEGSSLPVGE